MLGCVLAFGAGCGSGKVAATDQQALRLQREDLIAISGSLERLEGPVAREVAAARRAWPLIAGGLPRSPAPGVRPAIALAERESARIALPALLREAQAVSLTGPAALLAGLTRSYVVLSTRGWRMIGAATDQIVAGAPSARFARENVALYIESVYDAHFTLAQVGRKLLDGYRKLGGARTFGARLAQRRVDALARAYSEASDRLHPHVRVRLGS